MRDRRGLGWLLVGCISIGPLLTSSAWALDLDSEIQKQERESQALLPTIGRSRSQLQPAKVADPSGLNVQLLKSTDSAKDARRRSS